MEKCSELLLLLRVAETYKKTVGTITVDLHLSIQLPLTCMADVESLLPDY